jgi:hypothetical protein
MPFEKFTTYTKTTDAVPDPLVITDSTITGTAVSRDEDTLVYDDKTAGNFDADFTHLLTSTRDNSVNVGNASAWALTNAIDDSQGLIAASESFLYLLYNNSTNLFLAESDAGTVYTDFITTLTEGQTYYKTIERDESIGSFGQLTCKIYSDSLRTVLVDTLVLTLHAKLDLRYIFGLMSYDDNNPARTVDLTVSNLDLGAVAADWVPFFFDAGNY